MSKAPRLGLNSALWKQIADRLLVGDQTPAQVRHGQSKAALCRELAAADPAFKAKVKALAAEIRTETANFKLRKHGFAVQPAPAVPADPADPTVEARKRDSIWYQCRLIEIREQGSSSLPETCYRWPNDTAEAAIKAGVR